MIALPCPFYYVVQYLNNGKGNQYCSNENTQQRFKKSHYRIYSLAELTSIYQCYTNRHFSI